MPRATTSSEKPPAAPYNISKSKKRGLLAQSGGATLENIQALQKTGLTKHSKAANTTKKYGESVRNARKWLGASIEEGNNTGKTKVADTDSADEEEGKSGTGPDPIAPDVEGEDVEDPEESFTFDTPEYKQALDDIPNEHSPKVLSLYLTFKIFHQGLKIGTADTAKAAFKELWKMADGDTYRGRWHFNKTSNRWEGSPTESAEVEDTMKAIKNKCGADGGERTHSLAMTKEYMAKVFAWSDGVCPPSTYFSAVKTKEELTLVTKHLMYKAFSSTGWTIWTRNFELIKLKEKDLTFGLEDTQGFNAPYFELRLNNRKGWQRKISKAQKEADLRSGKYKICSQPDLPACDAHHWLPLWRKYLQEVIYRRPLGPEDYIFPAIGANGIVQVGEHVSHDDVQKWIKEFTAGAKLPQANGTFSTHCYRRGGAQYRFMFAPVGRRWTLRQVDGGGCWAEGRERTSFIKQLTLIADDYLLARHIDQLVGPYLAFRFEPRKHPVPLTLTRNPHHSSLVSTRAIIPISIAFTHQNEPTAGAVVAAIQPGNLLATRASFAETRVLGIFVKHWVDGDPAHGLEKPLRDWPKEWLAGSNKPKFAMKRREYLTRHNSDRKSFLEAFPEAAQGLTALLKAVNKAQTAKKTRLLKDATDAREDAFRARDDCRRLRQRFANRLPDIEPITDPIMSLAASRPHPSDFTPSNGGFWLKGSMTGKMSSLIKRDLICQSVQP
ncbi:hypothetical protein B0H14DRAFT_2618961 [Mycena olivaceomarginata]|nr:hypothetical protein B0H14DRAFT_2618961 [Mycena olivaceomarginata]